MKQKINYKGLTLFFVFLFVLSLFLFSMEGKEDPLDEMCQRGGWEYSQVDKELNTFTCCKMWKITNPDKPIRYEEGCLEESFRIPE